MTSFDFEYYRPDTLSDARRLFFDLDSAGKCPLYYGGGTEIISMARAESIRFGSVIDLKEIPELRAMGLDSGRFAFGSCVTLTEIAEANLLPLLSETVSRIADHTIQDKITLGGNLAGTVMYREAALPFMITDSTAVIITADGLSEVPFLSAFDGRLRLKMGEILVRLTVSKDVLDRPYVHVKKTRNEKIDYPLMTVCGINMKGVISAAVSGLANAPLILPSDILNSPGITPCERIVRVLETVRGSIMTDILGSKEYREFVLGNILSRMYANLNEC